MEHEDVGLLRGRTRLGHPPRECFVVEDAPAGVAAARRGGMTCVAVDRSGDADELLATGAGIVLDRLDRLDTAELLGRLEGRLQLNPSRGIG